LILAYSYEVPFSLFHASHLDLPLRSKKPGLSIEFTKYKKYNILTDNLPVLLSPTVACLKFPYKDNLTSLLSLSANDLTSSHASSN
jgi:hypothetical protein